MATKKMTAAYVAAILVMMVTVFGMTSCQGSEDITLKQAAPKTVYVPQIEYIDRDKLVYINQNWNTTFDGEHIVINGETALVADVNHKYPTIEMAAADHAAATITDANELRWHDSNGQETTGTLTKYESKDGSYTLYAALVPAQDYSTLTRLHAKVSQVTTYHILSGSIVYHTANGDEPSAFNFKLKRSYLLVDPSVDTRIINHTDTLIQVEVRVDTLIQTVEVEKVVEKVINHTDTLYVDKVIEKIVNSTDTLFIEKVVEVEKLITRTDTIKVEIEKFIKGADINKSVVNDFGFSVGTLTLGDKQLLKIMLNHKDPVLNVTKEQLGNVNFTGAGSLVWNGTDSQVTTGSEEKNNVTVKSFDYVRNEYTKVSETMYIVRTVYTVTGSFYNENGDICEFTMELAPSYIQKYDAPAPEVIVPEVNLYRGIIRKVSAEGLKLMTKPVVQKWNGSAWEDIRTASRVCIGLSGSPSGLDLFVKSRKVIEENEESHWYVATGNADMDKQWVGDDTKSDGTVVYRNTKVYDFNYMFAADAVNNGKVGPQTQLYVMRAEKVTVLDPDGNALVCTWEDGSEFSLSVSVKLNDTSYVDDPALVGTTRVESDKTYKYETTFTQNFTASIGGYELQNVESKSPLWVPVE